MTAPTLTCTAARHGTSTAYKKSGCRCPEARTAETTRKAKYERRRPHRDRGRITAAQLVASAIADCPPFHLDPRRNCADLTNPDLMFPTSVKDVPKAEAVCVGCPLKRQCADWALDTRQIYGVWGGVDERTRRKQIAERFTLAGGPA